MYHHNVATYSFTNACADSSTNTFTNLFFDAAAHSGTYLNVHRGANGSTNNQSKCSCNDRPDSCSINCANSPSMLFSLDDLLIRPSKEAKRTSPHGCAKPKPNYGNWFPWV